MRLSLISALVLASVSGYGCASRAISPADLVMSVSPVNPEVFAGKPTQFTFEVSNVSRYALVICAKPIRETFSVGEVFSQVKTATHRPCSGRTSLPPGGSVSWEEAFDLPGCDREAIAALPLLAQRSLCPGVYAVTAENSFLVGRGCPDFQRCSVISLTSSASPLEVR